MPVLTLGTQRDLTNDMLIKGIIDSVVTVNQFYSMLPFKGIQGNALAYNREEVGKDQAALVSSMNTAGSTINKDQQTFSRHSTELTTLIGDAQVNGLIQAVGSDYNDATAVQVAAKAKGIGRLYMDTLINGANSAFTEVDSTTSVPGIASIITRLGGLADSVVVNNAAVELSATNFIATTATTRATVVLRGITYVGAFSGAIGTDGTATLTAAGALLVNALLRIEAIRGSQGRQTSENGSTEFDGLENFVLASGNVLEAGTMDRPSDRLDYLDRLIDRVHDKDGMVDYLMMNSRGVRKVTQAFRDAGTGFDMMDVKTSSGGVMQVQSYRGVPIFRNDFIGSASNARAGLDGGDLGAGAAADVVYAGTIDDGSFTHGICGLTALKSAGMQVHKLGAMEAVDADITRVKWYCGLAHFSELGLVRGSLT